MPSLLSLSPFGVIVGAIATVAAVAAVVLVAPATVALAAFVVTLAVVATTFLTVDAGLIFDCRVPLPSSSDVADVTAILSTNVVEAGHVRARRKFVFWFSWI